MRFALHLTPLEMAWVEGRVGGEKQTEVANATKPYPSTVD